MISAPKLPLPKKITLKRSLRKKAMTIGIGFVCDKGIVLCSDSQVTAGGMKYYEAKISFPAQDRKNAVAGFAYAGNTNLMRSFEGKFKSAMNLVPKPHTVAKVHDVIETILLMMDTIDTDPDGLHMLCAIVAQSEFKLYKTERKIVSEVLRYDCIGVGDSSVLRYLLPKVSYTHVYRTNQALKLAAYLVFVAKQYIDGCGGDTTLFFLTADGGIMHFQSEIKTLEESIKRIDTRLLFTGAAFFNNQYSAEAFITSTKKLLETLENEREVLNKTLGFNDEII